jgi:hypothetical protein
MQEAIRTHMLSASGLSMWRALADVDAGALLNFLRALRSNHAFLFGPGMRLWNAG